MRRPDALSAEEQARLCLVAQGRLSGHAEEAEELLLQQYEPMLTQMACRVRGLVDFDDALQQARLAALAAFRAYNPSRGATPCTYVYLTVRRSLYRASRYGTAPIRFSEPVRRRLLLLDRTEQQLYAETGRPPSEESVASATGLTLEALAYLRLLPKETVSLHSAAEGKDGDELFLLDTIPDDRPGPETLALGLFHSSDAISHALDALDERGRDVIRRNFGLPPYDCPQSLQQIAAELDVRQSVVSDAKQRALRFLRHFLGRGELASA